MRSTALPLLRQFGSQKTVKINPEYHNPTKLYTRNTTELSRTPGAERRTLQYLAENHQRLTQEASRNGGTKTIVERLRNGVVRVCAVFTVSVDPNVKIEELKEQRQKLRDFLARILDEGTRLVEARTGAVKTVVQGEQEDSDSDDDDAVDWDSEGIHCFHKGVQWLYNEQKSLLPLLDAFFHPPSEKPFNTDPNRLLATEIGKTIFSKDARPWSSRGELGTWNSRELNWPLPVLDELWDRTLVPALLTSQYELVRLLESRGAPGVNEQMNGGAPEGGAKEDEEISSKDSVKSVKDIVGELRDKLFVAKTAVETVGHVAPVEVVPHQVGWFRVWTAGPRFSTIGTTI